MMATVRLQFSLRVKRERNLTGNEEGKRATSFSGEMLYE